MGALYEDVEKFFSDLFALYGRLVTRWPGVFVLAPLLLCGLLSLGLVQVQSEDNVLKLYTPIGSRAQLEQEQVANLFHDNTAHTFYQHQLVYDGTYAEVIVMALDGGNFFREEVVRDFLRLFVDIIDIKLANGRVYKDICAMRNKVS